MAQRLADLQDRRHDAAMMLGLSAAEVTYSLLETNPADTTKMRIAARAVELELLRNRVKELFGGTIRADQVSGKFSTDYAAAASLIQRFLADPWPVRP
jgi:hypothetical protein